MRLSKLVFVAIVVCLGMCGYCGVSIIGVLSSESDDEVWQIFDTIEPTLDSVEWTEEGFLNKTSPRIADGRWYWTHCDHFFIQYEHVGIFATFHESLNWTAVNDGFAIEGVRPPFPSFEAFKNETTANPEWWLEYSWKIWPDGLGIQPDKTTVEIGFDEGSARVDMDISVHITNIPAYFLGQVQNFEPLLQAFALTNIHLGRLRDLRWTADCTAEYSYYRIYFDVSADLMQQSMDTYWFSLGIPEHHIGTTCNTSRNIKVSMPTHTEILEAVPSNISSYSGNVIHFELRHGDRYPAGFSVMSGPPTKDLGQFIFENIVRWITEPEIWVALGTAIAAFYAIFHGKRIWDRQKVYYRLYRSMVSLYDRYSSNAQKFNQEMGNLSKQITRFFIEGKISDDQFDKLLIRRDDLLERAKKLSEKS